MRESCSISCWWLSSAKYPRNGGYSLLLDGVNSILYNYAMYTLGIIMGPLTTMTLKCLLPFDL